ncbi:hypothetical protein PVAND_008562 [Polypedilum vanderplanki]|uniref:Uncharacterized protein n=1 Tax=Polypedilum vanderplanki TaxID=319348 RepID=A0A9J6CAC7_POLVA|nr:hypothetical protein PVAND_008562 [Polypedilum vanderplanki]
MHVFWTLFVILFCSQKINCEDDEKFKRDISSGYFINSDVINKDDRKVQGKNENSKDLYMSPLSYVFGSLGIPLDKNFKTSVEYWPPDMDKKKFQKMWESEDSSFPFASWFNPPAVDSIPIKAPEISHEQPQHAVDLSDNYNFNYDYIPSTVQPPKQNNNHRQVKKHKKIKSIDIPVKPENYHHPIVNENYDSSFIKSTPEPIVIVPQVSEEPESSFPIAVDFNNFIKSTTQAPVKNLVYVPSSTTEDSLIYYNEAAMTNPGPIVFPTIEPTTARSSSTKHFDYAPIINTAVVPRANKKRKLKKKAKTSSLVTQFNIDSNNQVINSQTPEISAITTNDATATEKTSFQYSPQMYEIDNESIHYTDIISNLSNLTELSYSSNNRTGNNFKHQKGDHIINKSKNNLNKVIANDLESTTVVTSTTTNHPFLITVVSEDDDNKTTKKEEYSSVGPDYNYEKTTEKIVMHSTTSTSSHLPSSTTARIKKLNKSKSSDVSNSVENAIGELKKAIDDHDTMKVKNIVEQYENHSSIANIMNAMVLSANIKADKEKKNESTATTASYSEIMKSSKIHRSRFGTYRNMKPKYIDALKSADQHSTTSVTVHSQHSSTIASSSSTVKVKKVKTTASPKTLENLTSSKKKNSSNEQMSTSSLPPSSIKSRKFISTVRQYTPKARQIVNKSTTKSHSVNTTTIRSARRTTTTRASS